MARKKPYGCCFDEGMMCSPAVLFDGYAFGKIAGIVYVETLFHSEITSKQLQWDNGEQRAQHFVGGGHHKNSSPPERGGRKPPSPLCRKIRTVEDAEWTRRYHSHDPDEKAFGGKVVVTLKGGSVISDEIAVADAHPLGARPFKRPDYIGKFRTLAEGVIAPSEQDRFIATVERLASLKAGELSELTFMVEASALGKASISGIFDWSHHTPSKRTAAK